MFRGYIIIINDKNHNMLYEYFKSIIDNELTYNFIARKVENGIQMIIFVRHCVLPDGVSNLNFGATELSGIIVSNTKLDIVDTKDIEPYLNATNRLEDYNKIFREIKIIYDSIEHKNLFKIEPIKVLCPDVNIEKNNCPAIINNKILFTTTTCLALITGSLVYAQIPILSPPTEW
jgi:hypothetical protein